MRKLGLNEIREKYLAFFEGKEHLRLPSYSLVPEHDKSLLLINAGMAPMKPFFTGQAAPPARRVTTCQKCVRTGDIDIVGKTSRHVTFFEMLGNFSFGDYFKDETIAWAWEFVTQVLEIPTDRLYISIYLDDDEAFDIWHNKVGVPADRIFRLGKEDNFWELSLGPCGPCSEIYYDRSPAHGQDDFMASVAADEDRYVEFWNLVFTQFNKGEDGTYSNLASTNIDTGMGLERIAMIMQDVDSIFDLDTMVAIRDEVCKIAGVTYGADAKKDLSVKIITDHIRSATFMIADGVMPESDGRGYVLRRLIRRAARHGRLLGVTDRFLVGLSAIVIDSFKGAYPELAEKRAYIARLIDQEEQRFYENLDSGMGQLQKFVQDLRKGGVKVLGGADAFKLHDTFGFPLELTKEILEEDGLVVDEDGFRAEMEKQRNRARAAREDAGYTGGEGSVFEGITAPATNFVGYEQYNVQGAKILYIAENNQLVQTAAKGAEVAVIVDTTSVYAESGGQKADFATIITPGGEIAVTDCVTTQGGQFVHVGKVTSGEIAVGQLVDISIDSARRLAIARHHSATHLLHTALKDVLGNHVTQAGAAKFPDRLRLDFTHFAATTVEELAKIEDIMNDIILRDLRISIEEMPIADARARGAVALFGEKYGDVVRVVDIAGKSIELCGGTHLKSTAQIGPFKIVSEGGISAGVRRIEAFAGEAALAHFRNAENKLSEISALLKTQPENLVNRITQLINAAKDAEKQLTKLRRADAASGLDEILSKKEDISGIPVVSGTFADMDINGLRDASDVLMDKLGTGLIILADISGNKGSILARASKDLLARGIHCGNIVKAAALAAGGGGGGRPDMAQAGIKDITKMEAAMEAARDAVL